MLKHWIIVTGVEAVECRPGVSFDGVAGVSFEIIEAGMIMGSVLPPPMSAPAWCKGGQRLGFKLIKIIDAEHRPKAFKVEHQRASGY
ncbi:hypothetical protein ASF09_11725 [Sphingomonas sp. Leaf242]|nr:hypothetical protein ASF09_11725 [Sphingomonas sp. Leaf242]